MIQLKKILVPIDFSEPSQNALAYGLSLASQFKAGLVVVHVIPSLAAFGVTVPNNTAELEKAALASAQNYIEEFLPKGHDPRVPLRTVLKVGDVRSELLEIVAEEHIDLVVMGSHGRRSLERFILGSTTEHMLRKVPVPVLTVCHTHQTPPLTGTVPLTLKRILYATDLASTSRGGLRYAVEFARAFAASLTVIHAVDPLDTAPLDPEIFTATLPNLSEVRQQAEVRMRELLGSVDTAGMQTEVVVIEGVPHNAIPRYAEDSRADLLVINLQSKRLLERVMLGATAERVIRSTHIPVLAIPVDAALRFKRRPAAAGKHGEPPEATKEGEDFSWSD